LNSIVKTILKKEPICIESLFLDTNHFKKRIINSKYLFGFLCFAFLLRIPLLIFPEVIHNDGITYINHARKFLSGDWSIGTGITHPFYPLLITLAHYIFSNDELAGIGVSVFFGSLLIIPLFYLASTLFDRKVGFYSILFASVHPYLYIYSGSVLTESTFYFLLVTTTLFGWKAYEKGHFKDILFFSLFVSLCYLTRVESIGFLFLFVLWISFVSPPFGKRSWVNRIGIVSIAVCLFLAFSSPYIIQIKKETGKWQISKKISISLGSLSEEEEDKEAITKIREKKAITISYFIKSPLILVELIVKRGFQSLYKFQQVFTPYLFIIALIGIFIGRGKCSFPKGNLYLLSYSLYLLCFIHPLFRPGRRYATHVIPIALPWAAFGFLKLINWIQKKIKSKDLQIKIPVLFLILIFIALLIQGRVIHKREHRVIQKEAGLWMKNHLPRGSKLMSRMPQEAFYGELEWVRIPSENLEEILKEAHLKKVQYLVIDHEVIKKQPDFLQKMNDSEFELLKEIERGDYWIKIFRFTY